MRVWKLDLLPAVDPVVAVIAVVVLNRSPAEIRPRTNPKSKTCGHWVKRKSLRLDGGLASFTETTNESLPIQRPQGRSEIIRSHDLRATVERYDDFLVEQPPAVHAGKAV